ncbi:hypothetical protein JCM3770_001990 [Rhodotorula araucariae]
MPAPQIDLADSKMELAMGEKQTAEHRELDATGYSEALAALSPEEFRRLGRSATRKLDMWIMPPLILMFLFNFLDRQSISAAKLASIETDLNLSQTEYQTAVSILYVGYTIMQVPSNIFAAKIKWPGMYICFAMAGWGVISACTGAVQSYPGLVVCRFFLGFFEAIYFPGAIFFLTTFYTKKQYATRLGLLYSGSLMGNAIGGLLAIGILKLDGKASIAGWRWLFIIEGAATVLMGLVFAAILPNQVKTTRILSEVEREIVIARLKHEQGAQDNADEVGALHASRLAVFDPKTWLILIMLAVVFLPNSVNNFFPSLVGSLGYSRTKTYLLTVPPWVFTMITVTLSGNHSDKKRERTWHIICPLVVCMAANVIAISTMNIAARYVAMMFMPSMSYAAVVVILSWGSEILSQPSVKRAAALAFINCMANTVNIWSPYLFIGPTFRLAFAVNLGACVVVMLVALGTRMYLRRKNAELDRGDLSARGAPTKEQVDAGFRYVH